MLTEIDQYNLLPPKDLLLMGVETERLETVPISSVVVEDSLIDKGHATGLAKSMMGKRKQISPTTLRARLEGDKVVYDPIDGFHRAAGKRLIEEWTGVKQSLNATVLYGCSDEEMFDLRILSASSVTNVSFARMAEWMKQSFEKTRWQSCSCMEIV